MAEVNNYVNDISEAGYNPNPEVFINESLEALAVATLAAITRGDATISEQFGNITTQLQNQIDSLVNDSASAEKLKSLIELVNSLDLNTDGSIVNDLLAIKSIADNALEIGSVAEAKSDDALERTLVLREDLIQYKSNNIAIFDSFRSSIATLESTLNDIYLKILEKTSKQDVWDLIGTNNKRIEAGFRAGVAAFSAIMAAPISLDPSETVVVGDVV